ncbi:hypothetical protein Q1695_006903 [Nippostrongylus brasiliensis]|nr:hypothetical protein Q1695_006903 [Nippostrongylus brasiliensis]
MSKQLASHERLITIYRNKLEKVVASFKEDKLDALKTSESDRTPGFEKECRKKLQEGLGALEECSSRIEQAWQKYAEAYDQHDEPTETEKEDYNTYTERAEKALSTALDYTEEAKDEAAPQQNLGKRTEPVSEEGMSARDPDDDVKFLSSLMLDIQVDQTNRVTRVFKELQQIRQAFNHEVSAATLIHLQGNYIVTEENFILGTPAFRILTADKQLRNMLSTRERFSRLASRFVYITRIYRDLHIAANWTKGAKWKTEAEAIIIGLEKNRTRFDAVIKDMETELQKAEKDFREGPCTASAEHVNALFRRAFENLKGTNQDKTDKKIAELQALVEAQASELANMKKKIGEEKETTTKNEESDANDEKYFQVMLKEVKDDTEPDLETNFDENEELIVRSEADQTQEDPVETEPEAPSDQEETRQANQRKRPHQEEHRTQAQLKCLRHIKQPIRDKERIVEDKRIQVSRVNYALQSNRYNDALQKRHAQTQSRSGISISANARQPLVLYHFKYSTSSHPVSSRPCHHSSPPPSLLPLEVNFL